MKFLKGFVLVAVGVLIGIFLLNNRGAVPLAYLPGRATDISLALIIFLSVFAGAVVGFVFWLLAVIRGGLKVRAFRKESTFHQATDQKIEALEIKESAVDPEELLGEVEAAAVDLPDTARLDFLRARLLVQLKRDGDLLSIEVPKLLSMADPDFETVLLVSDRLAAIDETGPAVDLLKKLLRRYPKASEVGRRLLSLGLDRQDVPVIEFLMEEGTRALSPDDRLAGKLFLLESMGGKLSDRIKNADRLTQDSPKNPGPWVYLIRFLGKAGRTSDLAAAVEEAYKRTDSLIPVQEGVDALIGDKSPSKAISILKSLVRTYPDRIPLQFLTARTQLDLEMIQEAFEVVMNLGKMAGETVEGGVLAGKIALRKEEYEMAADFFNRAVDKSKSDAFYSCSVCGEGHFSWALQCSGCGGRFTLKTNWDSIVDKG